MAAITIDSKAPEGNAFMVLGKAKSVMNALGYERDIIDQMMSEAMDGDYDHLCQTVDQFTDGFREIER